MPWPASSTPGPARTNTQTGSSETYGYKLATEIAKQLCKAGLSRFLSTQLLCGYSFLRRLKGIKRREYRRQKERVGRQELDDVNEDKRTVKMKDLTERQRRRRWMGESTGMEKKEEEEGRNICPPHPSSAVDTVSVAAIRVRKTHQRFVCSVRVN